MTTLPPISRRVLALISYDVAAVLTLCEERAGYPCPPDELREVVSLATDYLLIERTRKFAAELRALLYRPAPELAELGARVPSFFNCYN
jgi:hypothetical protein